MNKSELLNLLRDEFKGEMVKDISSGEEKYIILPDLGIKFKSYANKNWDVWFYTIHGIDQMLDYKITLPNDMIKEVVKEISEITKEISELNKQIEILKKKEGAY